MRALLIVNPFASGVDEKRLARVRRALGDPEVARTSGPGDATGLARDACGTVDAIYVFGGDGTYNEVLNGLDASTPLGLVPGGGTSVLPRALGLPRDPVRAAERLAHATPRRIGLGRANGRRFGFSAGIGFDAELIRRVDALGRRRDGKRPGDVAFARTAARLLVEHRGTFEPALELDGIGRASFALVANGSPYTYLGSLGLRIAPRGDFGAGLDVVAPVRVGPLAIPRLAFYAVSGRGQERASDVIVVSDLDRLAVRCDVPQPMQLDGEDMGDVTEVELTAERDAVSVLV
ncbi:MAG TPA: diacylglycerol kinase family protein [Gaiellaceae bacterium]